MWAGRVVLGCLAAFWCLVLLVGAANPGYSQSRDYVSTLAARGADYGWLGVLAICAAALAIIATATLLRALSRPAAVLTGVAGIGFLVVAFTRLSCPNGPAGCGLGGRFDVSGFREITHSAAITVSAVLLVAAMAWSGGELHRRGSTRAGVASLGAAAGTAVAFLATGGSSPGWIERLGILVATGWMAVVAVASLLPRPAE
jgi:hypothetical membrane protein